MTLPLTFAHRPNPDGTHDSICTVCFRTVSSRQVEADLEQFEREHACPEIPDTTYTSNVLHFIDRYR